MANGDVAVAEEITTAVKDAEQKKDADEKIDAVKENVKTEEKTDVVKEKVELTEEKKAQIIRQLEYYFGDINLPRDKFLKEQTQLEEGWVPLTVLLTFKRLRDICDDPEVIAVVIANSNSKLLEVNEDRKKIRRNPELEVPEYNDERRKELMLRTAYVKGFPRDDKLEQIMKFFEPHGATEAISMRHYFDKATKQNIFKGSIFVIFKELDSCKKFVEDEGEIKYNDTVLIRKWQADYVEEKKQEREERNASRGKGKKNQEGTEAKKHTFPKGAILFMEGFTKDDTTRETIKKKVVEIFGSEPAYITFDKGNKDGYIRFGEENGAVEFAKKLTDNKVEIDGNDLTVKVLEGDEEETFLTNLSETLDKIRAQSKNSKRGRKRKGGFGGDGQRSKHGRK